MESNYALGLLWMICSQTGESPRTAYERLTKRAESYVHRGLRLPRVVVAPRDPYFVVEEWP